MVPILVHGQLAALVVKPLSSGSCARGYSDVYRRIVLRSAYECQGTKILSFFRIFNYMYSNYNIKFKQNFRNKFSIEFFSDFLFKFDSL